MIANLLHKNARRIARRVFLLAKNGVAVTKI